jgi:cytochrome c
MVVGQPARPPWQKRQSLVVSAARPALPPARLQVWRRGAEMGSQQARTARCPHRLQSSPAHFFTESVMTLFSLVKRLLGVSAFCFLAVTASQAAEQGSAAEAEAMVKKAVAHIQASGPEKAYDDFTNGKDFKDRDLYIIVYDLKGKNLAQGANAKLVGKDLINLKDPDGKPIIQMFVDLAKAKGKGWVEGYKFLNPVSKKMEGKAMYLERVGDTLVGCGIYKG